MADIRDTIFRQMNRRAFRTPTQTRAITSSGIKPLVSDGGTSPTFPQNAPRLTPSEQTLRAQFSAPSNPPPIDASLQGYQPDGEQTFTPSERELRARFSAPQPTQPTTPDNYLGNGLSGSIDDSPDNYLGNGLSGSIDDAPTQLTARPLLPREQEIQDLIYKRNEEANRTIEDDDSKLHNFFAGAQNANRQLERTGNSQADLGYQIGATLGGGIRNLFRGKEDDIQEQKDNLASIDRDIDRAGSLADRETARGLRNAQAENVLDKPTLEREKLRNRVEVESQKQNNRLDIINHQADIKSGEAKLFTDSDGKIWKQFLKPDSTGKMRANEPVVNPTTGEQEIAPGEQMVDWIDPQSGNTIKVKAKQVLVPGATLAAGNAQRTQQTNEFNTTKQIEVDRQNVQNQLTYQSQVNNVMSTIIGNDANLTQLGGNVSGINAQMGKNFEAGQSLLSQINDINAKDYSDSSKEEVEAANKSRDAAESRYNKLLDENTKLNGDLMTELGKSDAGKQKADQLQKLMPTAPAKLTFTPIQATKVSGGVSKTGKYSGQSYKLANIRAAFGGKTDAEIKQIVESNGGKIND